MKDEALVILRDLAGQQGKEIAYDANTKNVSVGGKTYTEGDLVGMGGQKVEGKWSLPSSTANQMLNGTPAQPTAQETHTNDMSDFYDKGIASNLESMNATLQNNLKNEMANLELTFQQAINSGQMSIREAEEAFAQQKLAIEQKAYQDSEATMVNGQQRGMQNSQQLAGMVASDNQRANSLINNNVRDRDTRIANIKDKLTSLATEKGVRSGQLMNQFNTDQTKMIADANSQKMNAMAGIKQADYEFNQKATHDIKMQDDQQQFTDSQSTKANNFAMKLNNTQASQRLTEMAKANGYELGQMAVQHEYQSKQISQQIGGNLAGIRLQNSNAEKMLELETKAYIEKQGFVMNKEYETFLKQNSTEQINLIRAEEREMRKQELALDPNSREGKLLIAQNKEKIKQMMVEASAQTYVQLQMAKQMDFDPNKAYEKTSAEKGSAGEQFAQALSSDPSLMGFLKASKISNTVNNQKVIDSMMEMIFKDNYKSNDKEIIKQREAMERYLKNYTGN